MTRGISNVAKSRRHRRSHARRRFAGDESLFEPLEVRTMFSAAGTLDPSFSDDGRATVDFGGGVTVTAEAVAVQADGKTVVAGTSNDARFALARFNLDGTLDTTFGPTHDGKVLTHTGGPKDESQVRSVLIDPSGRILVGGFSRSPIGGNAFAVHAAIARYLANGSLDPAFGNSSSHPGLTITDFGGDSSCIVNDMAIGSGGKIIVAGDTGFGQPDMMVACLNDDGHTDSSFGSGGHRFIGFGAAEECKALAVDLNGTPQTNPLFGSIVLVGRQAKEFHFTGELKFAVARLTSSGNLDNSFDKDGRATFSFPGQASCEATGVVIQSGNEIVVSGSVEGVIDSKNHDFALLRLQADGSLDSHFGGNNTGLAITNINGDDVASDMIQSFDGGLLVGGKAGGKLAIVKYTADGLLDSSFGSNGIVANDNGAVHKLARGPGRRFVVAGGAAFATNRYLDANANLVYATTFLDGEATESSDPNNLDPASFYVFRSERLPVPTRVYIGVGGSATFNADYTGLPVALPVLTTTSRATATAARVPSPSLVSIRGSFQGYVDIPANETFVFITITPVDDGIVEGDETATFTVKSDPAYEVGTPSTATIVIHDNDGATLRDTADAYVRDGASASTNFGSASDLEVKNNTTGLNRQTYLKFDLSSVSLASIGTVKLRLFGELNNANQKNVATSVFGSNNTGWSETTITFNNRPTVDTAALASTTIVDTTPRFYDFDITAYIKAQKAAGHNVVTLVLQNLTTSDPFASFASKEAGANGPQLVIAPA
jgi:uncharacterized delta-60 repeat protein